MKTCTRCGQEKPPTEFGRQAAKRDGLAPHCRACAATYERAPERRAAQAERLRAARKIDPERFSRYERAKPKPNPEKARARKIRWAAANPEKVKAQWTRDNKRSSKRRSAANTQRYRTSPEFRLVARLRARTRKALNGAGKPANTLALLGCTSGEFQAWVERQFVRGMSWDNADTWELDHHWPLSRFDLTDPRQIAKACHYTNIRPLFTADNRSKRDKMPLEEVTAMEAWKRCL
jgi:hypothetical protein